MAAALVLVLAAMITPATASATAGHGDLAREMRAALAQAPPEIRGRCHQTIEVRGLGRACRTRDGLFRLQGRTGDDLGTTHGADGPENLTSRYSPTAAQALANAGQESVHCVPSSTNVKHTKLVYSHPADKPSRYARIAPLLVQELYKLSAFLDAESRLVDPTRGLKVIVECDSSGVPVVHRAQLATRSASDSFSTVVSDLRLLGFGTSMSAAGPDRMLVFHDSTVASGAAGTGHLYRDDRASTLNHNNNGGMFAVEFAWADVPHWQVLLHELGHNMGAVQSSAPRATAGGHCNDGLDILCYADHSERSAYSSAVCVFATFDCNRNDYFHPSPNAGSYLAQHWNAASLHNSYLLQVRHDPPLLDTTPPGRPRNLAVGTVTSTSARLAWSAASDDFGVTGYRAYRVDGGRNVALARLGASARRVQLGPLRPGTRYEFAVTAVDAAGNESQRARVAVRTPAADTQRPTAIPHLRAAAVAVTSISLTWQAATDNVAVTRYRVDRYDRATARWVSLASITTRSYTVVRLAPRTRYQLRVSAFDAAGNRSAFRHIEVITLSDTTPPTRVTALTVTSHSESSATIAWGASSDNVAVTEYVVFQLADGAWQRVAGTGPQLRSVTLEGLAPDRTHAFRVQARDAAGNRSALSETLQVAPVE